MMSMSFKSVFDNPPDFVNELGTKWWIDKELTSWASGGDPDLLKHRYQFWCAEMKDGFRNRLITRDGKIIYDNPSAEAIAIQIDIHKMLIKEALNEHTNHRTGTAD